MPKKVFFVLRKCFFFNFNSLCNPLPSPPLEDTIDSMEGLGEGATKINCLGWTDCCCFTRFKAAEGLDSKMKKKN